MSTLLLLIISFNCLGSISEQRKFQLDSMVSVIPKDDLRNLDSLHKLLDSYGETKEEKVFMFYGIFGVHYKYDKTRFRDKKANEYTPYYTAYKKKAVCRDFSALFKELCERSKIECLEVVGRANLPISASIKYFIFFKYNKSNHVWNIVKFNEEWHLMDPTWTRVMKSEKHLLKDKEGKIVRRVTVKFPNRSYYDVNPNEFRRKHKPNHYGFYLQDTVNKFKRNKKKFKERTIYTTGIDYTAFADSIYENPNLYFSGEYKRECLNYSNNYAVDYYARNYWLFLKVKRSKHNPITLVNCLLHQYEFIKWANDLGLDTSEHSSYSMHLSEINKKIEQLKKKAAGV